MGNGRPISLWAQSAAEQPPKAPDALPSEVELAIVGGGFTGLSTALHAADAGLNAHVLEAREIGFGGSGRNVGLVNAGIWLPPAAVRAKLGQRYGPHFLQRFGDGPQMVFDLIERYQIQCEATRAGTIHAAHAASGMAELRGRFDDWQAMDAPVELLDADRVAAKIGTRAFVGGLLDKRAGTINPMSYVRGLARAANAAGAKITTGVKVTALSPENSAWRLDTSQGPLRAKFVVLGTNAYTDQLWPGLKSSFTPIQYFQFATAPLGADAASILPERQGVWDTGKIMISIRRDRSDRLIVGSMGRVLGDRSAGISHRWARRQIARLFPALGPVTFEEAWDGHIAMTADHLPRIHRLAERLYTPIAYNGRGITTGTIFGQAMAALLTGADPADLPLPITDVTAESAGALKRRFFDLGFTANQVLRGF
ncbi:MAG: FAD-binding oxidoreductase [Pseudomonadota bacterium]